jgi:hypothetical protein
MSAPPLREPKKPGRTCKLCIVEGKSWPKLAVLDKNLPKNKTGRTRVSVSPKSAKEKYCLTDY